MARVTRTTRGSRQRKKTVPSEEAIAVRAYELYVSRGWVHGCDVDDWLRAERELRGDPPEASDDE